MRRCKTCQLLCAHSVRRAAMWCRFQNRVEREFPHGSRRRTTRPHARVDKQRLSPYVPQRRMIRGFKHRGLKRLYENGDRRKVRADMVARIENILSVLDAAATPTALDLPGYRLHPLKGDRRNLWAVAVRANWRVVFALPGRGRH